MNEREPGLGVLVRWVAERAVTGPLKKSLLMEMNARRVIAQDILGDKMTRLTEEKVRERTTGMLNKLDEVYEGVDEIEAVKMKDTLTGRDYEVFLERVEGGWAVGERSGEEAIISRAMIGRDGVTSLTLDFKEDRFERLRGNPGIIKSNRYPRATVKVFELIVQPFMARDVSNG